MSRAPYPQLLLRMSPDVPKICCNRCSHSDMTPTQTQFLEWMGTRLLKIGISIGQRAPAGLDCVHGVHYHSDLFTVLLRTRRLAQSYVPVFPFVCGYLSSSGSRFDDHVGHPRN